jgi:hypothetical protein
MIGEGGVVVRFPPYVINGFHYGGADAKSLGCGGGLLLSLEVLLFHYAT